jgi:hypothetical protein
LDIWVSFVEFRALPIRRLRVVRLGSSTKAIAVHEHVHEHVNVHVDVHVDVHVLVDMDVAGFFITAREFGLPVLRPRLARCLRLARDVWAMPKTHKKSPTVQRKSAKL